MTYMDSFSIIGEAQPAGSKSAFVMPGPCPKCGARVRSGRAIVADANPKSKKWKQAVEAQARIAYRGPLHTEPVSVNFTIHVERPKSHFNAKGVLKPKAPAYPSVRPDLLKLARGIEDALTGVAWVDDSLIVTEMLHKRYGSPARVIVAVSPVSGLSPET